VKENNKLGSKTSATIYALSNHDKLFLELQRSQTSICYRINFIFLMIASLCSSFKLKKFVS